MRHRKRTGKLGRSPQHREALLSALVCGLICGGRIKTTLAKAKIARRLADRMITIGRRGDLAARRQALSQLKRENIVAKLFDEIAPQFAGRNGGYTRTVKLGRRASDSSEMVFLEWVDLKPVVRKKETGKAAAK